ncbi:hypothetical protein NQ314_014534 [Rhamnusium bicolor]|uniref:Zinc carboxypeptidase A 1 n=1 Tax=Rhamnusium bicolor TaxID=1586634 RepID=A0AAV8X1V5_9CUCU|nr:hypothetical protein NQ314_014534 [Rhamnusium bicolor]
MKLLVVKLVTLLSLVVAGDIVSYDGYKVYRLIVTTSAEIDLLSELRNDQRIDFWSRHRIPNVPVDAMVPPDAQTEFETLLKINAITYEVIINNFEETEIIGRSFERRNITLVTISSGGSNKPTIFADAGIHAREWIAPSMALYIINQLVENATNAHLYANVDWVLIPVANPDGYEFTHSNTRMWRKTRSTATICYGADPNRNFGYHWGESGSSTWQCDDIFAGRHAFSEVETQAIRNYLAIHSHHIKLYVAIHSHVNGTNYTVGNSAELLYTSAGCSDDYAKSVGIELSYTIELPGGGTSGFDLPPEDILSTVEETWEGFKAYHQYVENKFVNLTN